jgi:outer membrane protein TolC
MISDHAQLIRNIQHGSHASMGSGQVRLLAIAFVVFLLAGCKVGPNYHRPDAPTAPAWKEDAALPPPKPSNGTWKEAKPSDQALRGKWWGLFSDPQLDTLEDKVTVSNQTLKAAVQQYLQAHEQVSVTRAQYYPTLSIGPSVARTRLSNNQPNTNRNLTEYQYNTFSLGGEAQWEPDLWGRVQRSVEQARADMQASAADLANAELSVRAELAADYFQLRDLDAQKELLDNTIASY